MAFHLERYGALPSNIQEFILSCVDFLLIHNYFRFDSVYYLQIEGAPIGSTFSPSLANLFMTWWEERCIFSVDNHFGRAKVQNFLEYLNTNDCNFGFTDHWNASEINFMDVTLIGDVD